MMRAAALAALSPAEAALEAAIGLGFRARHAGRHHPDATVAKELRDVERFRSFVGRPPWGWQCADMDRYGFTLRGKPLATIRARQGAVRRYLDYARHPAYDWDDRCYALTGRHIPQICTPENTVPHRRGAATSKRRNLTADELERLFAHMRTEIERAPRRYDRLARATHFAVLCFIFANGTRARETAMGDRADLSAAVTPAIQRYSAFEDFYVRFGKSHDGGPPTQRSIVPPWIFRDACAVLEWYLREIRPACARPESPDALFLTAAGRRLRPDQLSTIFRKYRDGARLSRDLTLHCLRHSFETTLRECGYAVAIISNELGHASEATTLLYDHMGSDVVKYGLLEHNRALIQKSNAWRASSGDCAP